MISLSNNLSRPLFVMSNSNSSPFVLPRSYESIRFFKDGTLLLSASDLAGRLWTGVLCYFQDSTKALDPQYCTAWKETDSGISDVVILQSEEKGNDVCSVIAGYDCGGLELIRLVHDESGENGVPVFATTGYSSEHDDAVASLSLTSNKTCVVSGSHDMSVKVWDLESCTAVSTYNGAHWKMINKVDCNPESSVIFATCARDGRVVTWDTRLPRPATEIGRGGVSAVPTAVAWFPRQSSTLLIGDEDGGVVAADIRSSNGTFQRLTTNDRAIFTLEFNAKSPDYVAVCADDTTVSVLNVKHLENPVYVDSESHDDFVHGAAWNPITNRLYTSGWDQKVVQHSFEIPNSDTAC